MLQALRTHFSVWTSILRTKRTLGPGGGGITGKINQLLSASLTTTLIYDNDTDTDLTEPGKQTRVQFMEVFGLSFLQNPGGRQ